VPSRPSRRAVRHQFAAGWFAGSRLPWVRLPLAGATATRTLWSEIRRLETGPLARRERRGCDTPRTCLNVANQAYDSRCVALPSPDCRASSPVTSLTRPAGPHPAGFRVSTRALGAFPTAPARLDWRSALAPDSPVKAARQEPCSFLRGSTWPTSAAPSACPRQRKGGAGSTRVEQSRAPRRLRRPRRRAHRQHRARHRRQTARCQGAVNFRPIPECAGVYAVRSRPAPLSSILLLHHQPLPLLITQIEFGDRRGFGLPFVRWPRHQPCGAGLHRPLIP